MRKPCENCGGRKEPGQGSRLCRACRNRLRGRGKCGRCGGPKPSGQGRRLCDACKPVYRNRYEVRPCVKCGGYDYKSVGHRFCPECEVVEKEATRARAKGRRALKRKPCQRCGKPKGPGRRKKLCDRCHAERHSVERVCMSCGVKSDLGKFKKTCAQCRLESQQRQREKHRLKVRVLRLDQKEARRAQARKYDQKTRVQKLENQRLRYHLAQGGIKRRASANVAKSSDKLPRLPARPLAIALDELIRKESIGNPYSELPDDPAFGRATVVCERVGISVRTLLAWRSGEREEVNWDLVDAILTYTDLGWWDVWNSETVTDPDALERVRSFFEGAEVAA